MKRVVLWYAMLLVVAWYLFNEFTFVVATAGDNLRRTYTEE